MVMWIFGARDGAGTADLPIHWDVRVGGAGVKNGPGEQLGELGIPVYLEDLPPGGANGYITLTDQPRIIVARNRMPASARARKSLSSRDVA